MDQLHQALSAAFGPEWSQLCDWQRTMIAADFRDAIHAESFGCSAADYRESIGAGNLTSYALTRAAQWRSDGAEPGALFSNRVTTRTEPQS
jgi:hypothetical protein